MVSSACLEEVNRLRSIYRKDLPLYDFPESEKTAKKRKLAVSLDAESPPLKKPCKTIPKQSYKSKATSVEHLGKTKRPKVTEVPKQSYKRKASPVECTVKSKRSKLFDDDDDCHIAGVENDYQRTVWSELRFYPVDETWQRQACETLGLQFKTVFCHQSGGPDTVLTCPDDHLLRNVRGDGNCLFRALSYMITGSEDQHFALRSAIVQHILSIPHLLIGYGADGEPNGINLLCHPTVYESAEDYISCTRMDRNGTWGTNVEMLALAHIVNAPVYCYDTTARHHIWAAYFPNGVDRSIPRDVRQKSLYLYFTHNHFMVITAIRT